MKNIENKTGIYIAYPTFKKLKPIYIDYQTKVNNKHTKIGKAENSFDERKKSYLSTFNSEVVFKPIVIITDIAKLREIEEHIRKNICLKFSKVGRSREWFDTDNHKQIIEIIKNSLIEFKGSYKIIV